MNQIDRMRLEYVMRESDKAKAQLQDNILNGIKEQIEILDDKHLAQLCVYVSKLGQELLDRQPKSNT